MVREKKQKAEGVGSSHQTYVNASYMDTILITGISKKYIRMIRSVWIFCIAHTPQYVCIILSLKNTTNIIGMCDNEAYVKKLNDTIANPKD